MDRLLVSDWNRETVFQRKNRVVIGRCMCYNNACWIKQGALKAKAFKAFWICLSARFSGLHVKNLVYFHWNNGWISHKQLISAVLKSCAALPRE